MKSQCAHRSRQLCLLRSLIAISVAIVLVSGCGNSTNSSSSTRSTSLSSAQLAQKANALCRQGNASIAPLWQARAPSLDPQSASSAKIRQAKRVASVADEYNAKLRALKPPPKQAAAYARFMTAYERQASKLHKMAKSLKSGRSVRTSIMVGGGFVVALPTAADSDRAESSRIAKSLGLNACTGSTSGGV